MAARWNLFIVFPNLVPPVPSSFETSEFYLCASTDPRLKRLEPGENAKTARLLVRRFYSTFGERYKPGCLLVRTDASERLKNSEAIRDFRNVCAIATITRAWASSLDHPSAAQWAVKWSDSFLLGYHTPAKGGGLVTLDGEVRSLDDADRVKRYRG